MLMHQGFQASVSKCRSFASQRAHRAHIAPQLAHCTSLHSYLSKKNHGNTLVFQFCRDQDLYQFVRKAMQTLSEQERW